MLVQCWTFVCDASPTLNQHWVSVSCLLGTVAIFWSFSVLLPFDLAYKNGHIYMIYKFSHFKYKNYHRFTHFDILSWLKLHTWRVSSYCRLPLLGRIIMQAAQRAWPPTLVSCGSQSVDTGFESRRCRMFVFVILHVLQTVKKIMILFSGVLLCLSIIRPW